MTYDNLVNKYTYRVEWSGEDQAHLSRCLEFPSLSAHGDTPESALAGMKAVVSESIKWMEEAAESIPEPYGVKRYKGNLTLRIPPELHKQLAIRSAEEGVSVNQYILSKIS